MRRLALAASLSIVALAPATADDVHLKNGRVFEDVVADVSESTVTVHLAFGAMSFSLDAVERIAHSESTLIGFQRRYDALRSDAGAGAGEWIELARWAQAAGNAHGARVASLRAAEMNPRAEGIEELMRRLDFVFSPQLERWISLEESMRMRGYELVDGRWLSAEQRLARSQARAEAERAREADSERRLTRAVLALAAAQLAREPESRVPEPTYAWPVAVYPNPFIWRHENPYKLPPPGYDPTAIPIDRRQPGSLFPVTRHGGSFASAGAGSNGSH